MNRHSTTTSLHSVSRQQQEQQQQQHQQQQYENTRNNKSDMPSSSSMMMAVAATMVVASMIIIGTTTTGASSNSNFFVEAFQHPSNHPNNNYSPSSSSNRNTRRISPTTTSSRRNNSNNHIYNKFNKNRMKSSSYAAILFSSVGGGGNDKRPPSDDDNGKSDLGDFLDPTRKPDSENLKRAREYMSETSLPLSYDNEKPVDDDEEEEEDDDDDDGPTVTPTLDTTSGAETSLNPGGSTSRGKSNTSATSSALFGTDGTPSSDILAKNPYMQVVSKISPSDVIAKFTATADPRVQDAVRTTILGLIGSLPKMAFETTSITTGQRLASLVSVSRIFVGLFKKCCTIDQFIFFFIFSWSNFISIFQTSIPFRCFNFR
jgi:hypothetical protein